MNWEMFAFWFHISGSIYFGKRWKSINVMEITVRRITNAKIAKRMLENLKFWWQNFCMRIATYQVLSWICGDEVISFFIRLKHLWRMTSYLLIHLVTTGQFSGNIFHWHSSLTNDWPTQLFIWIIILARWKQGHWISCV